MGIRVELDFDAADAILVAVLENGIAMHKRGNKKFGHRPDKDEKKYLKAAKRVIDWHSVQT